MILNTVFLEKNAKIVPDIEILNFEILHLSNFDRIHPDIKDAYDHTDFINNTVSVEKSIPIIQICLFKSKILS